MIPLVIEDAEQKEHEVNFEEVKLPINFGENEELNQVISQKTNKTLQKSDSSLLTEYEELLDMPVFEKYEKL